MDCSSRDDELEVRKCLSAFATAIAATSPEMSATDRGRILKALVGGVDVGEFIQLTKNLHLFGLNRAVGRLRFKITADEPD